MSLALRKSDKVDIPGSGNKALAEGLSNYLADSFWLYMKTLNYHWNVEGPKFVAIHKLTEDHYKKIGPAIDDIAERIRAIGFYSPGTFKEMSQMTSVKEHAGGTMSEVEMVEDLRIDHEKISKRVSSVVEKAEELKDTATADMLTAQRKFHEEAAWMLRSLAK